MEKEVKEEIEEISKKDNHNKIKKELELLRKENELWLEKNKESEEKFLRFQAEFQNFKRRKDDEVERYKKYANEDLIKEMLPILDSFERAIEMDDNDLTDEVSKFLEGFKMIYCSFVNILTQFGVKEIEALDKPFDANLHQAVLTDTVEDKDDGMVLEVLQKGYILNEKVIRPAMVKVNNK